MTLSIQESFGDAPLVRAKPLDDIIKKSKARWSLRACPQDMGMVSSCKQTPNMDPPKRLSIAHWKALGESYLLSHKSSSGGVARRSYGR